MTIIRRITKDAIVNTLKDVRKVVNFSIAINDTYKPKGGKRTTVMTYCNCAYWVSEKMAEHLKKGTLVEVSGRIYVSAFAGSDGTAKASLNCRVSTIKIHACPRKQKSLEELQKFLLQPWKQMMCRFSLLASAAVPSAGAFLFFFYP